MVYISCQVAYTLFVLKNETKARSKKMKNVMNQTNQLNMYHSTLARSGFMS